MKSLSKPAQNEVTHSTVPCVPRPFIRSKGERHHNESGHSDASSWLFFDWDHPTDDEEQKYKSSQDVDHVSELLGVKDESKTVLDTETKPVSAVWLKRKNAVKYSNPSQRHEHVDHNGFIIPKMNANTDKLTIGCIKEEEWTNF